MSQPPNRERASRKESAAPADAAERSGKKRDPKALTLVSAGMLTILASVITLFVDKLSLPLYASLMIGLFGIGLAGAALIMQAVPEHWVRPVSAVAAGIAVLATLTFFLAPRPNAASPPQTTSQGSAGMTLGITPDHGRISTAFFVSGTCLRPGREVHVYFDGKDLVDPATCLADHTYRKSYSPNEKGKLAWFDGYGKQHTTTLSAGSTYIVYAQTTDGDWVSHSVKYWVG
jgi:hypothetical protein